MVKQRSLDAAAPVHMRPLCMASIVPTYWTFGPTNPNIVSYPLPIHYHYPLRLSFISLCLIYLVCVKLALAVFELWLSVSGLGG